MAEPYTDEEIAEWRTGVTTRLVGGQVPSTLEYILAWLATVDARDAEIERLEAGIAEALTDLPHEGHQRDGNVGRARCLIDAQRWPCDIEFVRRTLTDLLAGNT